MAKEREPLKPEELVSDSASAELIKKAVNLLKELIIFTLDILSLL